MISRTKLETGASVGALAASGAVFGVFIFSLSIVQRTGVHTSANGARKVLALGLRLDGLDASLQPPHAAQPTVVIGSLAAHVLQHLRMRQDQKVLRLQALYHSVGNLLGLERAFQQKRAAAEFRVLQHARFHALRTKRRNFDALVAIGDR